MLEKGLQFIKEVVVKSGKCVTLKSSEDIDAYFDSL